MSGWNKIVAALCFLVNRDMISEKIDFRSIYHNVIETEITTNLLFAINSVYYEISRDNSSLTEKYV